MTKDHRFYEHRRQRGYAAPPKDETEGIARRAWHQQGKVLADPAEIEAAGDWVTAQAFRSYAVKKWGERMG